MLDRLYFSQEVPSDKWDKYVNVFFYDDVKLFKGCLNR